MSGLPLQDGQLAQLVEHSPDKGEVVGSIPMLPTRYRFWVSGVGSGNRRCYAWRSRL